MNKLLLIPVTLFFIGATSPQNSNVKQAAIGTFSGESGSLCYTSHHLAAIMTYFLNNGQVVYNASLQYNSSEGFYLEGTIKKDSMYRLVHLWLTPEDNKLYITNISKLYFCISKIEGDCVLKIYKMGNVTRVEPWSKSGDYTLSPGGWAGTYEYLPETLVNYLNGLNIAECN